MTHKNIKRFTFDLQFKDSAVFVKKQDATIKMIQDHMRERGYVPVLDLGNYITVDYKDEKFYYKISCHGIYLGRRQAWETYGLTNGRLVPISTTQSKSEQSSETSAL